MVDPREIFEAARNRHGLLGRRGYPFPNIERLKLYNLPGHNNFVLASSERDPFQGRHFDIDPNVSGNVLVIDECSLFHGRIYIRGNDNIGIVWGAPNRSYPLNIHFTTDRQMFYWGPDCTSNTATFELGYRDTSILVGEDCMFSAFIDVKTSDDHCIVDCETGEHINPGANILFEPHVWVGLYATILKGVTVGTDSVIAARSLITKDVPARTIVGGVPAKILRTNCSWSRDRYHHDGIRKRVMALSHHSSTEGFTTHGNI